MRNRFIGGKIFRLTITIDVIFNNGTFIWLFLIPAA